MVRSHDSTPVLDLPEISSLRALTAFISTEISPLICTPKSAARRAMRTACGHAGEHEDGWDFAMDLVTHTLRQDWEAAYVGRSR